MLSNETRRRLVTGYERPHDAKMIAQAYGVSEREVYKLAAQMRETESVELRTKNRHKRLKRFSSVRYKIPKEECG